MCHVYVFVCVFACEGTEGERDTQRESDREREKFVLSVPKRNAARCFGHNILDVPRVHTVPTGRHLSEIDKENDGNRDLSGVALGMHDCV